MPLSDAETQALQDKLKNAEMLNTVILTVVILVLIWQMCAKKDRFDNDGLDYDNNMTYPVNDYDIMDRNTALSRPNAADMTEKVGYSQRMDWMTNRFDNAVTDNSNAAGMGGDSVVTPGAIGASSFAVAPVVQLPSATSTSTPVAMSMPAAVSMPMAMPSYQGCYTNGGPRYYRNDPRDIIGQSTYGASHVPIGDTNELQELLQYN